MTYTSFPHTLVETPFGTLEAWATSDRHVGFRTAGNLNVPKKDGEADKGITINRVAYTFRADLHPHNDPEVTKVADYQRVGFDRGFTWQAKISDVSAQKIVNLSFGPWAEGHPSAAAWRKIREELFPVLVAWILSDEGQALIAGGDRAHVANEIDRTEKEIAELEGKLEAARVHLAALKEVRV